MSEKPIRRSIYITKDTMENLEKMAARQSIKTSELIRNFIDKGLSVEGYTQDIDFITKIIRQELMSIYHIDDIKNVMEQQTNRLSKMMMKTGKLSSAEFFLMMKVLMYMWNDSTNDDFDQLLTESISLGVDYMQKKDFQINSFLEDTRSLKEKATGLGGI